MPLQENTLSKKISFLKLKYYILTTVEMQKKYFIKISDFSKWKLLKNFIFAWL